MNGDLGPNVKKLFAWYFSREAIPPGGSFADGVAFLQDDERRKQGVTAANRKLRAALQAVKDAPDNPYGDDDEAIAAAALELINERMKANRGKG